MRDIQRRGIRTDKEYGSTEYVEQDIRREEDPSVRRKALRKDPDGSPCYAGASPQRIVDRLSGFAGEIRRSGRAVRTHGSYREGRSESLILDLANENNTFKP